MASFANTGRWIWIWPSSEWPACSLPPLCAIAPASHRSVHFWETGLEFLHKLFPDTFTQQSLLLYVSDWVLLPQESSSPRPGLYPPNHFDSILFSLCERVYPRQCKLLFLKILLTVLSVFRLNIHSEGKPLPHFLVNSCDQAHSNEEMFSKWMGDRWVLYRKMNETIDYDFQFHVLIELLSSFFIILLCRKSSPCAH